MIQEGAYASLLEARRCELHGIAAEWFAERDPTLHAQHLDRAEDDRAPQAYLKRRRRSALPHHADAALRLAERGLRSSVTTQDRYALTCLKGELQRDLGDIAASIATYREAVAAATDEASLCRAQIGLAEGLRVSEGLAEALALAESAQEKAERHDLVPELARIHHLRGNISFRWARSTDAVRSTSGASPMRGARVRLRQRRARSAGWRTPPMRRAGCVTAFAHFSRCVELSREARFRPHRGRESFHGGVQPGLSQ